MSLRTSLDGTLIRFVLTGASAAFCFFLLSYALVQTGLAPFWSTLAAYGLVFAVTYLVQHGWTFRGRASHEAAFPRYLAVQIGCALLSALLAAGLGRVGVPHLPLAAITTIASSALSYLLSRFWAFRIRA